MTTFTITKKLLTKKSEHGNKKYPFDKMKVGESFEIPEAMQNTTGASARAFCKNKQPEWSFSVRKMDGKMYCTRVK